jgi:hypothetical protein
MTHPHDPKTFICFGKTRSGKSTFFRAMGGDVPEDELMDVDREAVTEEAEFYPINNEKTSHLLLCHAVMISAVHASMQGRVFEALSYAPTTLYYALTMTANAPICTLAAKVPQASYPALHASYIIWDALNSR